MKKYKNLSLMLSKQEKASKN